MSTQNIWVSPDGRIKKIVLICGNKGLKPTENCSCFLNITDTKYDVKKYNESPVVIGDIYNSFERLLHIVLTTMNEGEKAKVIFKLKGDDINLVLELRMFESDGFIFDWNARKKYEIAFRHKEAGIELFKDMQYVDASHRFSKAIKLLASIPIPVDEPPTEVDGLPISDVHSLKAILCNNLASCCLKHQNFETVIELCKRVLLQDPSNVKALYKMAVSYYEVHDYHKALDTLEYVLKLDPENKAAVEKKKDFIQKVNESNARVDSMIKKMFKLEST